MRVDGPHRDTGSRQVGKLSSDAGTCISATSLYIFRKGGFH